MTVLRLGVVDARLEASIGAIDAIERRLDMAVPQVLQMHLSGALKLAETAVVVTEAARAGGHPDFRPEDVARRLAEGGYRRDAVVRAVAEILLEMCHGPEDAGKKLAALFPASTPTPTDSAAPAGMPTS